MAAAASATGPRFGAGLEPEYRVRENLLNAVAQNMIAESYYSDAEIRELREKIVPTDPRLFYPLFGLLEHPLTHKPVEKLARYQLDVWEKMMRHRYNLVIKSQKIGLTTSVLMADFQRAILKPSESEMSSRGKEILIIAQDLRQAREHIYTLRKMIRQSGYYHKFLISRPTEVLMRDEVTKVTVLFIHNPDNIYKPTRIIGLGA
jgi:hypothetical protein